MQFMFVLYILPPTNVNSVALTPVRSTALETHDDGTFLANYLIVHLITLCFHSPVHHFVIRLTYSL